MGWVTRAGVAGMLVGAVSVGCWSSGAGAKGHPAEAAGPLPTSSSVVDGRFVVGVQLDGGVVRVTPAPRTSQPRVPQRSARVLMLADTKTISFRYIVLGFGVVTIASPGPGLPPIRSLPAWVGFSKMFASVNCPSMAVPPGSAVTSLPPLPALPSAGYAAFVLGAADGAPAVTYVARSAPCGTVVAGTLSPASEAISIPWHATGPIQNDAVTVPATLPPCGSFAGIDSSGGAASMTVTLGAIVPDVHGHCPPAPAVTKVIGFGPPGDAPGAPPPLVSARTRIVHGAVGPLDLESPG
jgi:hypothetical protein